MPPGHASGQGSPHRKGDSFLRAWVFQAHCTLRASPRRGQRSLAHVGPGEGICQWKALLLVTLCDRLCVCSPELGSEMRPVWGHREPSSTSGGGVWGDGGFPSESRMERCLWGTPTSLTEPLLLQQTRMAAGQSQSVILGRQVVGQCFPWEECKMVSGGPETDVLHFCAK